MLTTRQQKVIRDDFSMPQQDYRLIDEARSHLFQAGLVVTKSGILRAALHALHQLSIEERLQLIQDLEPIKTGCPDDQRS